MRRLRWWLRHLWAPRFYGHEWTARHGRVVCNVCGRDEATAKVGEECVVRVLKARGF